MRFYSFSSQRLQRFQELYRNFQGLVSLEKKVASASILKGNVFVGVIFVSCIVRFNQYLPV